MWPTIRNLGVFQGLWFLLVLGGDSYVVIAIAWAVFHLMRYASARERLYLPIYAAIGLMMDGVLTALGVLQFSTTFMPLWLVALWGIFPTTLHHGLRWCWGSHLWLIPLSAAGAAATYVGGARLADLTLPLGLMPTVLILTLCWIGYFAFVRLITSAKA